MDRRTVGMKNPGHCREVAVSGGSTVSYSNDIIMHHLCHGTLLKA